VLVLADVDQPGTLAERNASERDRVTGIKPTLRISEAAAGAGDHHADHGAETDLDTDPEAMLGSKRTAWHVVAKPPRLLPPEDVCRRILARSRQFQGRQPIRPSPVNASNL